MKADMEADMDHGDTRVTITRGSRSLRDVRPSHCINSCFESSEKSRPGVETGRCCAMPWPIQSIHFTDTPL